MSETKFTPGPWHLNTMELVKYTIHANRGHIATVSFGTMSEVSSDEVEANARLIASAPELLEAIEEYLESRRTCKNKVSAKHKLDVAIAKAKGTLSEDSGYRHKPACASRANGKVAII